MILWIRVKGLVLRVFSSGIRVQGPGSRVQISRYRLKGQEFTHLEVFFAKECVEVVHGVVPCKIV